ncbi:MAG: serine/threonine protein kinase, partial [Phototrophicales bacterium]
VLEYMHGGTLRFAVGMARFNTSLMSYVCRCILMALSYIHERKVAHRDLKSSNIMLDVNGWVKIIDFGLAADMSKGKRTQMVGICYLAVGN